ncbi:MAG: metallophosphoesterase [Christensenellaceae bacterium]|nr:metallophosphoesterase [Christensenellaceae bacterium]
MIFSDVHYCTENILNFGVNRKLYELAIPLATKITNIINSMKPDMVVNLGDMIEDTGSTGKDIKNIKTIWKVFKKIGSPFYYTVGNHDVKTLACADFAKAIGYKNLTYSVNLDGYHFVFLGVCDEETLDGWYPMKRTIHKKDIEWLKKDIKNNNLPTIVFLHHGLAEDDLKGNWWFDRCNHEVGLLKNRNEVKQILKTDKNLLAVFSGHQHWTKTTIEDGIPYHVIGSVTENINGDGKPDGIWFEVDVNGKELKITKHNLSIEGL